MALRNRLPTRRVRQSVPMRTDFRVTRAAARRRAEKQRTDCATSRGRPNHQPRQAARKAAGWGRKCARGPGFSLGEWLVDVVRRQSSRPTFSGAFGGQGVSLARSLDNRRNIGRLGNCPCSRGWSGPPTSSGGLESVYISGLYLYCIALSTAPEWELI